MRKVDKESTAQGCSEKWGLTGSRKNSCTDPPGRSMKIASGEGQTPLLRGGGGTRTASLSGNGLWENPVGCWEAVGEEGAGAFPHGQATPPRLPSTLTLTPVADRNSWLLRGWQGQDLGGLRQDTSLDSSPSTSSPCPPHGSRGPAHPVAGIFVCSPNRQAEVSALKPVADISHLPQPLLPHPISSGTNRPLLGPLGPCP